MAFHAAFPGATSRIAHAPSWAEAGDHPEAPAPEWESSAPLIKLEAWVGATNAVKGITSDTRIDRIPNDIIFLDLIYSTPKVDTMIRVLEEPVGTRRNTCSRLSALNTTFGREISNGNDACG
ncbi:hypothetical protein AC482_04390 [miscellaneous Crenarchaeota group-15 archaeon DG-45]|uniref:Uncharacterized protein n=1 Tax=miscellaneous Crenarchaeota group-15 archaeon DG-45 TaxID=1685127 RepID=A0A0M0BPB5_9ARCH|nr:MAG: hypothetical protein AC482_04390 [miscellaneous Crenarchaeota group-15 archaeon DG-45]